MCQKTELKSCWTVPLSTVNKQVVLLNYNTDNIYPLGFLQESLVYENIQTEPVFTRTHRRALPSPLQTPL
jgi:hypothetical protein